MSKITNTFVKLSQKQLEQKYNFIQNYKKAQNAAIGSSVDANSNVTSKNVATLSAEIHKDINVQLKRFCVSKEIEKLFGKDLADEYNRQIESHEIYVHDESHPFFDYCASVTMYPFLLSGLKGLGGESAAPKHLESFCGGFINLVFALSSQIAGACLYKDQNLLIKKDDIVQDIKIKDLINKYTLKNQFTFNGNTWEYIDTDKENLYVAEDQRFVKINKVFRRAYNKDIYKIKTHTGLEVMVSEDHKFKVLYRGRFFTVKAKDLKEGDTICADKDYTYMLDKNSVDYKIGQVIGIIAGDGSITDPLNNRVSVNNKQQFIMDFLDNNLPLLGITPTRKRSFDKRGSGCWNYRIGGVTASAILRSYFEPCEHYNTYEKNVKLEGKSLNFKLGVLDGLLVTDGCFAVNHGISLSVTNEHLIKNVQSILSALNIKVNYSILSKQRGNRRTIYKIGVPLRLTKYLDLLNKKPCPSSMLSYYEKHSHVDTEREVYYIGAHGGIRAGSNHVTSVSQKGITKNLNFEIKTDVIDSIIKVENDDPYVYEIETESHWYNCGGLITHNCSTVEFLLCFDYFSRKDFGDNYLETNKKDIENALQQVIYSINQPASARGFQSVFWNLSIFDDNYLKSLFGDFVFPDMSTPNFDSLKKLQAFFMSWFNEERRKALLTFPVVTAAMVVDENGPLDKEFLDMCAEQDSKGNSFFKYESDSVDSLSSCCRLKSELVDKQPFSFSLGAGGVQAGSINVITLNTNRLVQNAVRDGKDIYATIKEQVEKIHKYQIATRSYFEQYLDAGMAPLYSLGYLSLDKKFLTTGINGLLESAEFLGYKPSNNEEYKKYTSSVLKVIYDADKADYDKYKDAYWQEISVNNKTYNIFSLKKLKVVDTEYNDEVCLSWKDIILDKERYIIEESELEKANGRIE